MSSPISLGLGRCPNQQHFCPFLRTAISEKLRDLIRDKVMISRGRSYFQYIYFVFFSVAAKIVSYRFFFFAIFLIRRRRIRFEFVYCLYVACIFEPPRHPGRNIHSKVFLALTALFIARK